MDDITAMLEKGSGQSNKNTQDPVVKIVSILFKARDESHITHLSQPNKTLARHDAFSIFYDEILDIIDTLYETWSGIHDTTPVSIEKSGEIADPIKYFTDLYNTIETLRKGVKESFIQNQIDTAQQEIAHALFRLKKITT